MKKQDLKEAIKSVLLGNSLNEATIEWDFKERREKEFREHDDFRIIASNLNTFVKNYSGHSDLSNFWVFVKDNAVGKRIAGKFKGKKPQDIIVGVAKGLEDREYEDGVVELYFMPKAEGKILAKMDCYGASSVVAFSYSGRYSYNEVLDILNQKPYIKVS